MRKILYLIIWAAMVYLGILYYSPALIGLSVLDILLPIGSAILQRITIKGCKVSLYLSVGVAEKDQPIVVGVEVENTSAIPISRMCVRMTMQNGFYSDRKTIVLRAMAEGKGKTRLTTAVTSRQCGLIQLKLEEVQVYDLLGMFEKKIPAQGQETLAVMPELYTGYLLLEENKRSDFLETEEYDKTKPGDDHSEIFQIREYRGGDRLQSIHWKLSARTDVLMVKEYSLPTGSTMVLYLDMEYEPDEGYGYLDEFIEAGLAVSSGLLEEGWEHYVVWFDRSSQDLVRIAVKEKDDLYLVTQQLLAAGPYPVPVMLTELYKERYRGETLHMQVLLNLKKELWLDEHLWMELDGQARELLEKEKSYGWANGNGR
jgi:uncharacterized protein (DUF58 family)